MNVASNQCICILHSLLNETAFVSFFVFIGGDGNGVVLIGQHQPQDQTGALLDILIEVTVSVHAFKTRRKIFLPLLFGF